jgi:hypothetical protein
LFSLGLQIHINFLRQWKMKVSHGIYIVP